MTLYWYLIIGGLVIVCGSFIFAAFNMFRGVMDGDTVQFRDTVKKHVGAMIGMAIGGFIFVIGFIILIMRLIEATTE